MKTVYIDCPPYNHAILRTHGLLQRVPDMQVYIGEPDRSTLHELVQDAVALINGRTYMDAELLRRSPALKTIVFLGTGASSYIDLGAAEALGIEVRTVIGYGDRTVAEHAMALMLAASRNVALMDRDIRCGKWHTMRGLELTGKRLGIVGLGAIGRTLAHMGAQFGMEVVAWNRSRVAGELPCKMVTLDELLETSQLISLHLALNEATENMIDAKKLALMRHDAILINVARGALVDERALIDALRSQRIAHAALDVFDQEPLPPGHPLTTLDNVTLTAHAGFSSEEAIKRLLSQGIDALEESMRRCQSAQL